MPQRLVRPGINSSARVEKLGDTVEVFYRRLMLIVDDFGRFEADYALIRSACYPRNPDRVTLEQIGQFLTACEQAELIALYTVGRKRYLWFFNLGAPRAKNSIYPPPPENICSHVHADANTCEQTQTNAPLSNSVSVSSSYSSSLPCSVSVSEANGGAAAKQSKPSAETCETPCADADAIAWTLASDLAKAHAAFQPGRVHDARALIERLLASATDPVIQANAIRESHRLYCLHWAQKRQQKPNAFVPQLARWIQDGDYLQPPPEPVVGTGGSDW